MTMFHICATDPWFHLSGDCNAEISHPYRRRRPFSKLENFSSSFLAYLRRLGEHEAHLDCSAGALRFVGYIRTNTRAYTRGYIRAYIKYIRRWVVSSSDWEIDGGLRVIPSFKSEILSHAVSRHITRWTGRLIHTLSCSYDFGSTVEKYNDRRKSLLTFR